jgi:hypothetical protein
MRAGNSFTLRRSYLLAVLAGVLLFIGVNFTEPRSLGLPTPVESMRGDNPAGGNGTGG